MLFTEKVLPVLTSTGMVPIFLKTAGLAQHPPEEMLEPACGAKVPRLVRLAPPPKTTPAPAPSVVCPCRERNAEPWVPVPDTDLLLPPLMVVGRERATVSLPLT